MLLVAFRSIERMSIVYYQSMAFSGFDFVRFSLRAFFVNFEWYVVRFRGFGVFPRGFPKGSRLSCFSRPRVGFSWVPGLSRIVGDIYLGM